METDIYSFIPQCRRRGGTIFCLLFIFLQSLVIGTNTIPDFRESYIPELVRAEYSRYSHRIFSFAGVHGFEDIQLYRDNSIFVSGINHVFRLHPNTFAIQDRAEWRVSKELQDRCRENNAHREHCNQYRVKVMLVASETQKEDALLVCLTNGEKPICTERKVSDLNTKLAVKWSGYKGCPIDPRRNVTALIASDGYLYVGSMVDKRGLEAAILRKSIGRGVVTKTELSTKTSLSWLQHAEPVSFVESFELGPHVYFVFREIAEEMQQSCNQQTMISRIARVCMADQGGKDPYRLQGTWTSFNKATMICEVKGEKGTNVFNLVQSVFINTTENVLYATFTTPDNTAPGSALCEYRLKDLNSIFHGPFYRGKGVFKPTEFNNTLTCEDYNAGPNYDITYKRLDYATKYQLMFNQLSSRQGHHIARKDGERWTHILVDHVQRGSQSLVVFFVATDRGSIRKIHRFRGEICFVEEIFLDKNKIVRVNDAKLIGKRPYLVVSTNESILRIPTQRCNRLTSSKLCTAAQDPYCAWDNSQSICTTVWSHATNQITPLIGCPDTSVPLDGAWGPWSDWRPCQPINTPGRRNCQCRTRLCNSPSPYGSGKPCVGSEVQVGECTVDGGWTRWTEWSQCSVTCGPGIRKRMRSCSNPRPTGPLAKLCEGESLDEQPCTVTHKCADTVKLAPWGPWTKWTNCSRPCGTGHQVRLRQCLKRIAPPDAICDGTGLEYRSCHTNICPDHAALSSWTDWLRDPTSVSNPFVERRFRVMCSGKVLKQAALHANFIRQERVCTGDKSCDKTTEFNQLAGYAMWSRWSTCSRPCGGGIQQRRRNCTEGVCQGKVQIEEEHCNTHRCIGYWDCWGDWNPCSKTCGVGSKTRQRECLTVENTPSLDCPGASAETRSCEVVKCSGAGDGSEWAGWSECNSKGIRARKRRCFKNGGPKDETTNKCPGPTLETQSCQPERSLKSAGTHELASVIVVGITMFILGFGIVIVSSILIYKFKLGPEEKRRRRQISNPDDANTLLPPDLYYPTSPGPGNILLQSPHCSDIVEDVPWDRCETPDSRFIYGTYRPPRKKVYDLFAPPSNNTGTRDYPAGPINEYPTLPIRMPSTLIRETTLSTFGRPSDMRRRSSEQSYDRPLYNIRSDVNIPRM